MKKVRMKLCECGCGIEVRKDRRFVRGHNWRGKNHWSKNEILSKEIKKRISKTTKETMNNPEFKEEFLSIVNSEEYKKNLSEKAKERWADPEFREKMQKIYMNEEIKKRKSEAAKEVWQNSERRKERSEITTRYWQNLEYREKISLAVQNGIGYFFSKKMNMNIFYQFVLELKALELFEKDENIWSIERCNGKNIEWTDENGNSHKYKPDFFINKKFIIEVKRIRQLNEKNNFKKFEAAKAFCKENNLEFLVLTEKDLDCYSKNNFCWR